MKARTSIFRRLYGRTLRELADEYAVTPSAIWRWHYAGKMPVSAVQKDETKSRRQLLNRLNKTLGNIEHRCSRPLDKKYRHYGGKGIRNYLTLPDLERLWHRDRAQAMSHPSIDRKNNADHYTFLNCRFIEMEKNRRGTTVDGCCRLCRAPSTGRSNRRYCSAACKRLTRTKRRFRKPMIHAALLLILLLPVSPSVLAAQRGTASFYTIDSAIREGTCTDPARRRCLMANGRPLNDDAFTSASWDYPFGTRLRVCQALPQRPTDSRTDSPCRDVVVSDRGPSKRLYRQGRILDLSKQAFQALADLSQGVIEVTVEPLP